MDHRLIEGLMEAIAPLIKSYVDDRIAKDIAPLRLQVSEYKSMMPERGEPGLPGKDVDWKEVEQLVLGITDQKFAIREAVHDETVRPIVEEVVAAHVAKIAPGEPGKD